MGAESFYVKLLVEPSDEADLSITQFIDKLNEQKIKCIPTKKNEFVIEDFIIMTTHVDRNKISGISFEGCFSWFDECLLVLFKIITIIQKEIFQLKLVSTTAEGSVIQDQEEFSNAVQEKYCEKYNDFLQRYGVKNLRILPREDFYNYYNKQKKKGFLKRYFMK